MRGRLEILAGKLAPLQKLELAEDFRLGLPRLVRLDAAVHQHNALEAVVGRGTVIAEAQLFPHIAEEQGMGRAAEQGVHEPGGVHIPVRFGDADPQPHHQLGLVDRHFLGLAREAVRLRKARLGGERRWPAIPQRLKPAADGFGRRGTVSTSLVEPLDFRRRQDPFPCGG